MMRKWAVLMGLLIVLMGTGISTAVAQTVDGSIQIDQDYTIAELPKLGQKIKILVTVSTSKTSPVPINGFWLAVIFQKPSGAMTNSEWFDFTTEVIPIGQAKRYYLATNTVADQPGKWRVYVELYTADKKHRINTALAIFYVSSTTPTPTPPPPIPTPTPTPTPPPIPEGSVRIEQIMGYTAGALGMLAAALYFMRR